ncbi:hypothetical protein BD410DRAFT_433997 [Rickenella mellea]|uniref:DUF6593 domain-containing protein n=1 Tax=Rickenella mellea TaxID=50990 RepID=A0A4Y7PXI4_9AGAM|nr:hypothetical protein BD410DRAFT_433997 [Rickenella mellea]
MFGAHNNPYYQGGWTSMPPLSPASSPDSSLSPPSTISSGSSSTHHSTWNPPQTAYGGLPPVSPHHGPAPTLPHTPGEIILRLAYNVNPADFPVIDPSNRPLFRIYTGGRPYTTITQGNKQLARIEWHQLPVLQRRGVRMPASQFLRPNPPKAECCIRIDGADYKWITHSRRYYLISPQRTVAVAEMIHGNLQLRCIQPHANLEFLEVAVISIILLQGRKLVGLPPL